MLYINPLAAPSAALSRGGPDSPERTRQALNELEHLFAYMLLQEMRKTVPEAGLFGGREGRLYEALLDDALSGEIARARQLGVADGVEKQLRAAGLLGDMETPTPRTAIDWGQVPAPLADK